MRWIKLFEEYSRNDEISHKIIICNEFFVRWVMKDFFEEANLVKEVFDNKIIFVKKRSLFGINKKIKVITFHTKLNTLHIKGVVYLIPRRLEIKRKFYSEMIDYFCKKSKIPRSNYASADTQMVNQQDFAFLKGSFKEYLEIGPDHGQAEIPEQDFTIHLDEYPKIGRVRK